MYDTPGTPSIDVLTALTTGHTVTATEWNQIYCIIDKLMTNVGVDTNFNLLATNTIPNCNVTTQQLHWNGTAMECIAGSSGVSTFLALTDVTPSTYVGQGGKVVKVNAGSTALEFGIPLAGPSTSTSSAIALWNSSVGTALKDSLVTIDSAGNVTLPTNAILTGTVVTPCDPATQVCALSLTIDGSQTAPSTGNVQISAGIDGKLYKQNSTDVSPLQLFSSEDVGTLSGTIAAGNHTHTLFGDVTGVLGNTIESDPKSCTVSASCTVNLAGDIITGGTASKCARFDNTGTLVSATGDCTAGNTTIPDTTCDSINCNLGISTTVNTKAICLADGTNCPTSSAGHIIQDEGVNLPAEPTLDFIGTVVTCTDDPATSTTKCVFTGGAGGGGDVTGPSSATDTAIALFDTTSGKLLKNSLITVDILGNITLPIDRSFIGSASTTGGILLSSKISGGSFDRLQIFDNGKILIGDGTAVGDTNLYRNGANKLKTDDDFFAKSATLSDILSCTGDLETNSAGLLVCGTDNNTTYTAGDGMSLVGTVFSQNGIEVDSGGTPQGSLLGIDFLGADFTLTKENGCVGGNEPGSSCTTNADCAGSGTCTVASQHAVALAANVYVAGDTISKNDLSTEALRTDVDKTLASATNLNVGSGATIEVLSGGDLNVQTGGDLTLADTPVAGTDAVNKTYSDTRARQMLYDTYNVLHSITTTRIYYAPGGGQASTNSAFQRVEMPIAITCSEVHGANNGSSPTSATTLFLCLENITSASRLCCSWLGDGSTNRCKATGTLTFAADDKWSWSSVVTGTALTLQTLRWSALCTFD